MDTPQQSSPIPHYELRPTEIAEFEPEPAFRPSRQVWRVSILLFIATCLTTFFVGAIQGSISLEGLIHALWTGSWPQRISTLVDLFQLLFRTNLFWNGVFYSLPLMSILLLHEFGHYLQARRYRVPASPPMFIPLPIPPFGTMGAVIVQSPHHADRRALFDIAISGPLAGLCLALPVAWWGISISKIGAFDATPSAPVQVWGDPMILKWMIAAIHDPLGPDEDVALNPILMAGWVGIYITALNLIPIGQLDGGHILYCLIGRRAHYVAFAAAAVIVPYLAITQSIASAIIVMVLLRLMGLRHPPTTDDRVPLGPFRIVLGWLTLAFLLIGINPKLIYYREPVNPPVQPPPAAVAPEEIR